MDRTPPSSTRDRGRIAEQAAATFLVARGLEVLTRNYSAAGAEIDLVMRERAADGETVCVFVEVRSRASGEHGHAIDTIDRRKQRQIIRGATAWLVAHDLWERVAVRFDVIGIASDDTGAPVGTPTWLRGAFELG